MSLVNRDNGLWLNATGLRHADPSEPFLELNVYPAAGARGWFCIPLNEKSAAELRDLADQVEQGFKRYAAAKEASRAPRYEETLASLAGDPDARVPAAGGGGQNA